MPSSKPTFGSYISSTGEFDNTLNNTPILDSYSVRFGKLNDPMNGIPSLLANPSIFRLSGSSYFGRFNDVDEVDNSYTPIDSGIDMIFGGTGFEVDAGSDLYVGTIVDSQREAIWIPLPACSMTTFYVASSVAPGTGETFTFTVYKDTVATAMSTTISGSGTSASYNSSSITFSAGEKFSVRIVTSSGAQTAYLTYSVRIE